MKLFKQIDCNISVGPDYTFGTALRESSGNVGYILYLIFKRFCTCCELPEDWKIKHIVHINIFKNDVKVN